MKTSTLTALIGAPLLFFFPLFLQPFASQAQEDCDGYAVELFITGDTALSGNWGMINSTGVSFAGDYNGGTETLSLCLDANCYNMSINIMAMGEQEGHWVLLHADTALVGGHFGAGNYVVTFGLDGGCEGVTIFGCTDPLALNYDPNATMDGNGCLYDEDDCELTLNVIQQTCNFIQLAALTPGPPFPIISWTVNGEAFATLPGALIAYQFETSGSYTFCGTQNGTDCEICETYEIEVCSEGCGDFSFEFVNEGEPDAQFIAWFAPVYDGDLSEGMVFWDFDAGSSPVLSNDSLVGYQYGPGTYEICATFSTETCQSEYCGTVTIGGTVTDVFGCTDSLALNYNPAATVDDGSCEYESSECSVTFLAIADSAAANVLNIVPYATYDEIEGDAYDDATWVFWNFGDGNISDELYPSHTYDGNGPYELCVTVGFGSPAISQCITTYCMEVDASLLVRMQGFSIQVISPLSLSSAASHFAERLRLWPNPAYDVLSLDFSTQQAAPVHLRIFDLNGKMLHSENYSTASGENRIDMQLGNLPPGMYMLQLSSDKDQLTRKFVVAR